ncbi:hypothetical protein quinque_009116 [Culex quinquefasciatus]
MLFMDMVNALIFVLDTDVDRAVYDGEARSPRPDDDAALPEVHRELIFVRHHAAPMDCFEEMSVQLPGEVHVPTTLQLGWKPTRSSPSFVAPMDCFEEMSSF